MVEADVLLAIDNVEELKRRYIELVDTGLATGVPDVAELRHHFLQRRTTLTTDVQTQHKTAHTDWCRDYFDDAATDDTLFKALRRDVAPSRSRISVLERAVYLRREWQMLRCDDRLADTFIADIRRELEHLLAPAELFDAVQVPRRYRKHVRNTYPRLQAMLVDGHKTFMTPAAKSAKTPRRGRKGWTKFLIHVAIIAAVLQMLRVILDF